MIGLMNKVFTPFNDEDLQWSNAVQEVNNNLDAVMNHYGLFLNDVQPLAYRRGLDDFSFGRMLQFSEHSRTKFFYAQQIQREITRLTWFLSKCFPYGESLSIRLWNNHRNQFEFLKELLNDK